MDSLQIGDLALIPTPKGLEFVLHNNTDQAVTLRSGQLNSLRAFLDQYSQAERRIGFRVPMGPLSGAIRDTFEVRLKHHGHETSAHAVDFSLTGILVEAAGNDLHEGDQITATLCLENDCVLLNANVVRRQKKMLALHFPACLKDGELEPPETLLNIYRTLELEWLKGRVHA